MPGTPCSWIRTIVIVLIPHTLLPSRWRCCRVGAPSPPSRFSLSPSKYYGIKGVFVPFVDRQISIFSFFLLYEVFSFPGCLYKPWTVRLRKWIPRWDDLDDVEDDGPDFIGTGVTISVIPDTRQKYEGAFSRYIDFIVKFSRPMPPSLRWIYVRESHKRYCTRNGRRENVRSLQALPYSAQSSSSASLTFQSPCSCS